jgi:8-hydroxy-5-deazaflavin:NADPH oxidoreductase
MNVGIFGGGRVGQTLGSKLVEIGEGVMLGVRSPAKLQEWQDKAGGKARVGSFAETATYGEILINAVKGGASLEVLAQAGASSLSGKILIDLSNSMLFAEGKPTTLLVANSDSVAEQIQRTYPQVRVVKTLNMIGVAMMVNPRQLANGEHDLFLSGNDADAKVEVTRLLSSWFGWRHIIDLGDITTARGAEMYVILWNNLRMKLGTPLFNIKIVQ